MGNPIKLKGVWDDGYAFDYHTVSSEYIGEDPFGNKLFKTAYTEIGGLLYKMKYNGHQNTVSAILELCSPFLDNWLADKKIDCVLPMPPTNYRDTQPVYIIAEAIAKHYNIPYTNKILTKTSSVQSKNLPKENKNLTNTIKVLKKAVRRCSILLIDDLYATGTTATECTKALKKDDLIDKIYLFSITKTRT